jgi:Bacterial extracellular solute-binding protein
MRARTREVRNENPPRLAVCRDRFGQNGVKAGVDERPQARADGCAGLHEAPGSLYSSIFRKFSFSSLAYSAKFPWIRHADPAKGGVSSVYFARVLNRLGIADQLKDKTILVPGAQAPEVAAKGDAELGVAQASEIVPVAGAQMVGPLPGELASMTVFTGGIGAASNSPEETKTLIKFLTGPEAVSRLKTKGFEPG